MPVDLASPKHRSVSQLESYSDCGIRYKLERIDKVPQSDAWWNVGGTSVHYAIEQYEKKRAEGETLSVEDTQKIYANKLEELSPTEADEWLMGWRKASKGKEDKEWWIEHGEDMVFRYVQAAETRTYEILRDPIGNPIVEWVFDLDVDGIIVRGYINQAFLSSNGSAVLVRDVKAGKSTPSDSLQTAMYGWALRKILNADVRWGSYWMARKGEQTPPIDLLARHPWEEIVYRVHTMDKAENAGIYLPRVSSFCISCSVKDYCPAQGNGSWT